METAQVIFLIRRHESACIKQKETYPDKHYPFVIKLMSTSTAIKKEIK
jgi:hypothetical protein